MRLFITLILLLSLAPQNSAVAALRAESSGARLRSSFGPRLHWITEVREINARQPLRPLSDVLPDLHAQFEYVRGFLKFGDPGFEELELQAKSDPANPRRLFLANLKSAVRHFELSVAAIPRGQKPGDLEFEAALDRATELFRSLQFMVYAYREIMDRVPGVKAGRSTETDDRFKRAREELLHADHGRLEYLAAEAAHASPLLQPHSDPGVTFRAWKDALRKTYVAVFRRGTQRLDQALSELQSNPAPVIQDPTPARASAHYLSNLVIVLKTLDQEVRALPRRAQPEALAATRRAQEFYAQLKPLVARIKYLELKEELSLLKANELKDYFKDIGNRLLRRGT